MPEENEAPEIDDEDGAGTSEERCARSGVHCTEPLIRFRQRGPATGIRRRRHGPGDASGSEQEDQSSEAEPKPVFEGHARF